MMKYTSYGMNQLERLFPCHVVVGTESKSSQVIFIIFLSELLVMLKMDSGLGYMISFLYSIHSKYVERKIKNSPTRAGYKTQCCEERL